MNEMRITCWLLAVSVLCTITGVVLAQAQSSGRDFLPIDAIRVRMDNGHVESFVLSDDGSGEYVRSSETAPLPAGGGGGFFGQAAIGLYIFGLFGQAMFMGRFALQWFASERAGKSIVPLGFWWLSLSGASILLAYFIIQREPIGVLGQLLGWPIYMRNIYMVLRERRGGGIDPEDPAEHPVADPNAEA